jgi:hypothetical protein
MIDMLSNITWTDFFAGTFLLAAIYYLYVVIKFYPEKLKGLFAAKKPIAGEQSPFVKYADNDIIEASRSPEETETDRSDLDDVEDLVTELVTTIQGCSEKQMVGGEFKQALRMVLRGKPLLKTSPYRPSINELIVSECGKHGTFTPSEKEVDFLWDE